MIERKEADQFQAMQLRSAVEGKLTAVCRVGAGKCIDLIVDNRVERRDGSTTMISGLWLLTWISDYGRTTTPLHHFVMPLPMGQVVAW
ncbi:hypothetical protein KOR42_10530 [Thalassoglobus neptunius]|uniref:Uncharacterized protein n=1 Tax=Thalassoglobus neptunius TaxID=1938619 RepID=A0A5C5X515_9PLAN|nr:hypothetical protein [Thalassoglobus neptunius]TWT57689.1 hypothetical protein KOR42_10530 [Thalassoglobus neptunius]